MFVLYYQTISDYEYVEVKLISASLDKFKLDTIRTELIDKTKFAAKIYSDRSTEVYNFHKDYNEKIAKFLKSKNSDIKKFHPYTFLKISDFYHDVPELGVPPERLPFPDPYYCDESLVIDQVEVI